MGYEAFFLFEEMADKLGKIIKCMLNHIIGILTVMKVTL